MERVVVIGTGRMAPGIAAACACAGSEVHITGRDRARADHAAALAGELAQEATGSGDGAIAAADLAPDAFATADLVLETIVEDLEVKRGVLRTVDPWLADDAIVASNTSSLPIADIGAAVERPERVVGLHFLSPAHRTLVVEVVASEATRPDVVDAARAFVERMGKRPLTVRRDVPGFLWNRLQFALLRECWHLLDAGIADAESIEAAVADGLAPRWVASGPLASTDLGGAETFARVAGLLFPHLSDDREVPEAIAGLLAQGGFFRWTPEALRAIDELRADALAAHHDVARRRLAAMPPPATRPT